MTTKITIASQWAHLTQARSRVKMVEALLTHALLTLATQVENWRGVRWDWVTNLAQREVRRVTR